MAYTNSPLVSYTKLSPNHSGQRNHAIDTITIHCVVGQCSVQTLGEVFAPVSRQASSNYGVGYDGKIGMYVEEKNRSWCTSSASNDHRAITIEVASDTTEPYAVRDVAYNATIQLVADICKRNGIKKLVWSTDKNMRMNHLNGCNMTVHRDYANKSCPGKYLYDRMGDIAAKVNAIIGASGTSTPTTPSTPTTGSSLKFKVGDIVNFAGGTHYSNANATSGSTVKASKAKITQTYNGKHPYHCRAVNDAGAFVSGVYGWVDENTLSAIQAAPAPSAPSTGTSIVVGSLVKITGSKYYSGSTIPSWVKAKNWYVKEISGDRAVIDKSEDGKNAICSPIKVSDIALVSGGGSATTAPAPTPWTPAVGDVVNYNGNVHYSNANAASGIACKGGKAKITQIYQLGKSKHPYHLVHTGSGCTVYGWVDAGTFTKA